MTTNGEIPVGDTEMAECDGEVVTMMDVLKEQQEFEDDANAVLGGSDEKECTYLQGYIKRQAIYACMTCCPDSKDDPSKRAGFCLACSLTCHENHDLVELYTKRNFRCDCGNPKFKTSCQFTPNKPDLNDGNIYNQNFVGLYCSCSKPYGEQESTLDDEMIQCVICEDWWHASHLEAVVPPHDQFSEMICKLCMANNDFLHSYSDLAVNVDAGDVDVVINGVDSTVPKEKITSLVTDETLTNGSVTDENLTDNSMSDEKQLNGIEDISASNEMETNTVEDNQASFPNIEGTVPEKAETKTPEQEKPVENNQASSPDIEGTVPEKAETETPEQEKPVENNQASSPDIEGTVPERAETETPEQEIPDLGPVSAETTMDTSDNPQEKISKDENELLTDKTEDKLEESKASTEMPEHQDNDGIEQSITEAESKENGDEEVTDQANSETVTTEVTEDTENFPETLEPNESIQQEQKDAEGTTNSSTNDTDKSKDPVHENTDQIISETPQDDETKCDLNKSNEQSVDENPIAMEEDNSKVDETIDDPKEHDSTNNIEISESAVPDIEVSTEKRKLPSEADDEDHSAKKPKLDGNQCIRPKGIKKVYKGATFWPSDFRQKLCTCSVCITMYKDLSVLFLTDMEDTVTAYETLGKERTAGKPNQYEKGIEALCSLGRIQQIDALTEYNKMKDKLLTFLQSFKENKEIVTERDIKTFFAGMKPEKRNDGVYFCG